MPAALAHVAVHRAVQLVDALGARRLVQAVDVLRDHGGELALALQLGQLVVRLVGLCPQGDHPRAVEVEELLGVGEVELVAQHLLRRVLELLMIEAVLAPEIWDAASRRDPRAAKEHDSLGTSDSLGKLLRRL